MGRLFIAKNLRQIYEEWLLPRLENGRGTILVATPEQKKQLKSWIIKERSGLLGWNILTREEQQRQQGAIGLWELVALAKIESLPREWPAIDDWVRDLVVWQQAGYGIESIPLKKYAQPAIRLINKVLAARIKLGWQMPWEADIAIGFNPLQLWGVTPKTAIACITSDTPTTPEEVVLRRWEELWGEAVYNTTTEKKEQNLIKVALPSQMQHSILEQLKNNKNIDKIVYSGTVAEAVLINISAQTQQVIGQDRFANNKNQEWLVTYKEYLQDETFDKQLEYLRNRHKNKSLTKSELCEIEKTAAEKWQKEGVLSKIDAYAETLPEFGSTRDFVAASRQAEIKQMAEELNERLRPLAKLLPRMGISKEVWLELLAASPKQERYFYTYPVIPLTKARGLIDENTLVVWSGVEEEEYKGTIDIADIKVRNADNYFKGSKPEKGWIEADQGQVNLQIKAEALQTAHWVALDNKELPSLPEGAGKEFNFIRYENRVVNENQQLVQKHHQRMQANLPFGNFDYAFGQAVSLSCKQWESVVMKPEIAWYEILKLSKLWGAHKDDMEQLWVGTWVHNAMEVWPKKSINQFFTEIIPSTPSLKWWQAWARAKQSATIFAYALTLAQTKDLAVEYNINTEAITAEGVLKLKGRIDRIVQQPDETILVLDFKTGSTGGGITDDELLEGDGLQLWLYARAWYKNNKGKVGLCRLAPKDITVNKHNIAAQVVFHEELLQIEKEILLIANTGVLGQKGKVWGRFGSEYRLPIAAWPQNYRVVQKKRKATYERA